MKTAAEKMFLKAGHKLRIVNAPAGAVELLGGLPPGAVLLEESAPAEALLAASTVLLFAASQTELETLLPGVRTALAPGGVVWVLYPKGTVKRSGIHRDTITKFASTLGLTGVSLIAVDATWSALRLKAGQ